jgi:polygalacturonase
MGTSSVGGFRNVTITNCVLVAPRYSKKVNGADRGIGGINLELVDGGVMDRIAISNITSAWPIAPPTATSRAGRSGFGACPAKG